MAHAVAGRVGHASSNAQEASDIGQAQVVGPETCPDTGGAAGQIHSRGRPTSPRGVHCLDKILRAKAP
jgi:hypothetical protein